MFWKIGMFWNLECFGIKYISHRNNHLQLGKINYILFLIMVETVCQTIILKKMYKIIFENKIIWLILIKIIIQMYS